MSSEETSEYDRKVAQRIEEVVKSKRKNQSWLARLFGITPAAVNKRYKMENPRYSIGEVLLFCKVLDVELDELIFDCVESTDKDSFRYHLAQLSIAVANEEDPTEKLKLIRRILHRV